MECILTVREKEDLLWYEKDTLVHSIGCLMFCCHPFQSDLLELFVSLSRKNPSEIALTSLLSNPTSLDYLTSANNYSLPVC